MSEDLKERASGVKRAVLDVLRQARSDGVNGTALLYRPRVQVVRCKQWLPDGKSRDYWVARVDLFNVQGPELVMLCDQVRERIGGDLVILERQP